MWRKTKDILIMTLCIVDQPDANYLQREGGETNQEESLRTGQSV
jgi:hypothetical protein